MAISPVSLFTFKQFGERSSPFRVADSGTSEFFHFRSAEDPPRSVTATTIPHPLIEEGSSPGREGILKLASKVSRGVNTAQPGWLLPTKFFNLQNRKGTCLPTSHLIADSLKSRPFFNEGEAT